MKIAVLADGNSNKATWSSTTTSDFNGQPSATLSFSITPQEGKAGTEYTYVGIYPASVFVDESSVTEHKVHLNVAQNATADSYDPEAYILVARPDAGHNASNTNWKAYFRRATAINKLTLKNLPETIESVQIIAPDGKKLSGYRFIDLSTGTCGEVYAGDNTVTINYATPNAGRMEEGVNCKTVWFTSWDTVLSEGEE